MSLMYVVQLCLPACLPTCLLAFMLVRVAKALFIKYHVAIGLMLHGRKAAYIALCYMPMIQEAHEHSEKHNACKREREREREFP